MVGVDGRGRIDLETVVVLASILKKAIHGVQNFVGQQEEPFPAEQQDTSHHARDENICPLRGWEVKAGLRGAIFT